MPPWKNAACSELHYADMIATQRTKVLLWMAYRLELSDLPPRYRAQAEALRCWAGRGRHCDGGGRAMSGLKFDESGRYEYSLTEIVKWEAQCFLLFPAKCQ